MKGVISGILLSFLMVTAFAQNPDSATVFGQLTGKCNFNKAQLHPFTVSTMESLHTDINSYGFFQIKVPLNGCQQYTLTAGNMRYDFIVTPAQTEYRFAITCRDDGDYNVKLEDSKENEAFDLLGKIEKKLIADASHITRRYKDADSLYHALANLNLAQKHNLDEVARAYPGTYTARVLAAVCSLPIDLPREGYIDSFIFYTLRNGVWNDVGIYHTDFPLSFISIMKNLVVRKSEAEKDKMIDDLLEASPANPEAAKLFQQALSEYLFYDLEENRLRAFCDWAANHPGKIISDVLKAKLQATGRILPGSNFIAADLPDSNGVIKPLSAEINNHSYTLVLFWSPDCDHCIAEMPSLVSFYKKYKPKGLEVYAVGIDSEVPKWKDFIAKNTPGWVNVHDVAGRSGNTASDYMVNYTPTLVLIDKSGKILSRFGNLEWIQKILADNGVK